MASALPRRSAARLRPGESCGHHAGHRHRLAPGYAKGIRHRRPDCRRAGGARSGRRGARHRAIAYYENIFRDWAFRHPATVAVHIGYDEALAHKIEAGADMFLMPSRYEPCGLNQIYSLKYGTVPVVRATGGLDDTIEEWDAEKGTGTGFKFAGYDPKELLAEIDRALEAFQRQGGLDAADAQRHGARLQLDRTGEGIRAGVRRCRAATDITAGPISRGGRARRCSTSRQRTPHRLQKQRWQWRQRPSGMP